MIKDVSRGSPSWNVAPQPRSASKSGNNAPLKEVGHASPSDDDLGLFEHDFDFSFSYVSSKIICMFHLVVK